MTTNYAKIYEFKLNNSSDLTIETLLQRLLFQYKRKKHIETDDGTFYIKDFRNANNSLIFLFGKDNQDASNYKREISTNNIEKIDINEDTEILTDFVHISISKVEVTGSYTLLLEKNSLITHHNLISFLRTFFRGIMAFSLSKRVTTEFYQEVLHSNRIISISQIAKKPKAPFVRANSEILNYIEVKENIEVKAKRSKTIPVPYFNKFYSRISNDPDLKLVVEIVNNNGNKMLLDFDSIESKYTITTPIEENNKTDLIQRDISVSLNSYIGRQNRARV